jgi:threonine aldolase
MDEAREREAWKSCERFVAGMDPRSRDPRSTLLALAERAPAVGEADRYGDGLLATRLEGRVAELLGKEAAVWMPSGTMAQQIALRIHALQTGRSLVAFHPHCHLDVHEERGYEWLHGLRATLLGERNRLVRAADVARLSEPHAAVLLELPQRDLGGQLPPWDDLAATAEAARAAGCALHLDGARLWQCGPYYARPLDEIAALFDSVYVSFYKDLGASAGCALAGSAEVIAQARIWLVRHGGRMFSVFPLRLAAERGLDEVLPRMPRYVEHAHALAAALAEVDGLSIVPDPPHAAMFHLYVKGDAERLAEAAVELAESTRTWLGAHFLATADPAVAAAELTIGEPNLAVTPREAAELYSELVGLAA